MNREETLALYEQGVNAWNKWANEMLEERKKLEEAGEWKLNSLEDPANKNTRLWYDKAAVRFTDELNSHTFKDKTDFSLFTFPAKTYFTKSIFANKTSFKAATFHNSVCLQDTKFKNDVSFEQCKFLGAARFNKSTFNNKAKFPAAIFYKNARFDDCNFMLQCEFSGAEFYRYAWFSRCIFKGYTSFQSTKFLLGSNFSAIRSDSFFTFRNTIFKNQLPNFIQASFTEAPRLDNVKLCADVPPGSFFNSIFSIIKSDIKAFYKALKRLAIQAHDHENEQRFWAGELRSDRSLRTEDGGWNLRPLVSAFWWGNIAYEFFSDFGRSIVRPLIGLVSLMLLMTCIHIYAHSCLNKEPISTSRTKTHMPQQSDLKDCDISSSAFRVAAKNGAIGLLQNPAKRSTFVRDYTCLYGTYNDNVTPKIPNSIFWIELFHTLFSAILIFLTLLGIRNNFKLK